MSSPYRNSGIPYNIRRSDRARRARIVVDRDGVEVVVPRRMALREVAPFVAEKQDWIERTRRRYEKAQEHGPQVDLRDGGSVPLLGRDLALRVRVEPGRVRAHVALREVAAPIPEPARAGESPHPELPGLGEPPPPPAATHELHVAVGEAGPAAIRHALERWYRRRARDEVAPRLDAATARAGTAYTNLTIRGQRTRWASCSDGGAMNFNWRLLLAPAEILDYVVEHEVAHLEVMGHSRRFWSLVERRCPDYRRHERWLRRYGSALHL
jgi:predicted metal-dependent hydrolase